MPRQKGSKNKKHNGKRGRPKGSKNNNSGMKITKVIVIYEPE